MENSVVWADIPAHDFERAVRFYSAVFDQELFVHRSPESTLAVLPHGTGGISACILPANDSFQPSTSGTRVYLNCTGRLDDAAAAAEKAGGKRISEKFSIGDHGWVILIEDSEGNRIGLHSQLEIVIPSQSV